MTHGVFQRAVKEANRTKLASCVADVAACKRHRRMHCVTLQCMICPWCSKLTHLTYLQEQRLWVKIVFLGFLHLQTKPSWTHLHKTYQASDAPSDACRTNILCHMPQINCLCTAVSAEQRYLCGLQLTSSCCVLSVQTYTCHTESTGTAWCYCINEVRPCSA